MENPRAAARADGIRRTLGLCTAGGLDRLRRLCEKIVFPEKQFPRLGYRVEPLLPLASGDG